MLKRIYNKVNSPKFKPSNIQLSRQVAVDSNTIIASWSESKETSNNFGDALNPWLFNKLVGKKPVNVKNIINYKRKPVYSVIGSVLDNNPINELIVWGSGFKYENSTLKKAPKSIHAVRGPLSRNNLVKLGLYCPEVYGDPALLLPKFYNPEINRKYKLGIIPHYVDKENKYYRNLIKNIDSEVLLIDIEDNIEVVIDQIKSCELIASSSLHGLIVADAYEIPSLSIKFSNNVKGGNFKFKDYMYSVGRADVEPLEITNDITINNIIDSFTDYKIDIDLDRLLNSCPFN
ncbi:polysaccharide pyruvyl transferase family protein [Halobacillus yeomjeoni]|uniref:polysaccharide pyruvyl transferase family protein n=1 Tax=Halobacillus yeomjeoni TaxID=311194 RepID=UPI001CD1A6F9|nr:polysaccharide pyruvyl transferase family protein [Halobacillus yeomjeoni]MCA0985179.1 polysaccharide pyruvyl transferase family protein [Halobacillus yeomjeoni]